MDSLVNYILGGNYVFSSETIVRLFCVALSIEFIALVARSFNRSY